LIFLGVRGASCSAWGCQGGVDPFTVYLDAILFA
jgi:hypothetical protein